MLGGASVPQNNQQEDLLDECASCVFAPPCWTQDALAAAADCDGMAGLT